MYSDIYIYTLTHKYAYIYTVFIYLVFFTNNNYDETQLHCMFDL